MADELSIWDDDLEGVTERRAVLPGPVAVLNDFVGVESTRGRDRDRLQHGVVAIAPLNLNMFKLRNQTWNSDRVNSQSTMLF